MGKGKSHSIKTKIKIVVNTNVDLIRMDLNFRKIFCDNNVFMCERLKIEKPESMKKFN